MSDFSQRLAGLSPEKLKLLAQRLNKKKGEAFSPLQINPQSRESNSFPLSFAQQRLWFLDQLQPGNIAYNISQAMHLKGWLHVAALEQSFNEIVRRHEVLRTTFAMANGQPVQVISPSLIFTLPVVDLTYLPKTTQKVKVQQLATNEAQHPFDLAQGPLLRVTLLKLGEAEHVLLFVMHHIVSDAKSCGIIIQELAAFYKAFSVGKPSLLPELSIQYADFAHWQRQWLQGAVLEEQIAYWKQQLADAPPFLALPTDRLSPAIQSLVGDQISFKLSPSLSAMLKKLSQSEGATLFITLLAAFQILLYRYSTQDELSIGTAINNRKIGETDTLIGCFVNTLVLRANLSGNPSFRELLDRVREVALTAYAHQDLPFEKLVEELQPERILSQNPFFRVMFVFWGAPMPGLELGELSSSPIDIDRTTSRFDLTLAITDTQQGLEASFEYNTDLFDAATITRMVGHFQTLLSGIVANPDQRLTNLPILTGAEQHQLLIEWNHTGADYPQDVCIHQLFEAQVECTPNAVAVVFEDELLTYSQLNDQANQMAHHLRSLGIIADSLVGLCVERSPLMIIGLLGILKAGGAYVPLDPTYPQERLTLMLFDAKVSVLLTQQHLLDKLPEHQARVVCLDSDRLLIAQHSQCNPNAEVMPGHLAYVIYTSGSTGKPKGVLMNHHNVVRLFKATQPCFHFDEDDVWTMFHSYAFDFSVWEIWGALVHGGRLVVVPYWVSRSPAAFYKLLCAKQVTIVNQTPSAFRQFMQVEQSAGVTKALNLRLVIFGGEALDLQSLKPWFERYGDKYPQLVNMYGITETTVHVTYRLLTIADLSRASGSIIGGAIPDLQIYLLDQHLQPVPIGVRGEMYIGGAGLARGYLNRPELSAECFIPNPFENSKFNIQNSKSNRLYKTGDLARYLPDGNIEFLGRIDHQVKIRGFRIELGEIEAVLAQHPDVRETVVLAGETQSGDKQLVGYVVPSNEQTLTTSQLRNFLKKRLPEYMVPSVFVILETLPLLANGKVNRSALRIPDTWHRSLEVGFVPPCTPIEEILANLWTEILGVEIGIYDNFFTLGGHSLLASQVISRVHQAFQVELPLRSLFEFPTVAELSKSIEANSQAKLGLPISAIKPISRQRELPLSFAQERFWFLAQLEGRSATYNMPAAVRLGGTLNVVALEMAVQEIVRRHEILRTNFLMENGSAFQVIDPSASVNLPIVDLQSLPKDEQSTLVRQLTALEAQQPFDLTNSRLLRVTLLWLGKEEHVLLVTMHHIIFDGLSIGIFIQELSALYASISTGTPSTLPELPIQYADFACWQRNWLTGEVLKTQLQYWKQQLAGSPPLLELPTDQPRPTVQTYRGAHYSFVLPKTLTEGLKGLSQTEGVTLFMTLLAAFTILLSCYTGQEDIVVGSPIANRNRVELEGLIGLFVNTLALRTDLSSNPSFRELLARVRQVTLGAYSHKDLPFEKLVQELAPKRNLRYSPLFQVWFALQNVPTTNLELPGLTLSLLNIDSTTVQFDLELFLSEGMDGLSARFNYNTDLFKATTIAQMANHFEILLLDIVEQPTVRLEALAEKLTEVDRQQALLKAKEFKKADLQMLKNIKRKWRC